MIFNAFCVTGYLCKHNVYAIMQVKLKSNNIIICIIMYNKDSNTPM